MAVQLAREVNNTGISGDYWALVHCHQHREGTSNDFTLSGMYRLWKDAAAFAANKRPIRSEKVQVSIGAITGNPTVGTMQTTLDDAAIAVGGALEGGNKV